MRVRQSGNEEASTTTDRKIEVASSEPFWSRGCRGNGPSPPGFDPLGKKRARKHTHTRISREKDLAAVSRRFGGVAAAQASGILSRP